jgi:hypothetical protein
MHERRRSGRERRTRSLDWSHPLEVSEKNRAPALEIASVSLASLTTRDTDTQYPSSRVTSCLRT